MEVVATTGTISRAKLQSNRHHQQTNTQFFYRLDALPVAQPTVSKHRREMHQITNQFYVLFCLPKLCKCVVDNYGILSCIESISHCINTHK